MLEPIHTSLRTGDNEDDWIAFVDSTADFRRDLFRYCRRITRTVWDAEDLVQETMLRCFVRARRPGEEIRNPRAFLFRTATHVWIDIVRRRETEATHADALAHTTKSIPADAGAARDAGVVLFGDLSPQERASVVLKDVIGLSLADIAEILETTTGAVKSALHRGRKRLEQEGAGEPGNAPVGTRPSIELVDRFVAAFNALDVEGLAALLLEDVTIEVIGIDRCVGRDRAAAPDGWIRKSLLGHEPWALASGTPSRLQRAERFVYDGESIVVVWLERDGVENVEWICRVEERDGGISGLLDYCLCPETQEEVTQSLGLSVAPWGYRLSDEWLAWEKEEA